MQQPGSRAWQPSQRTGRVRTAICVAEMTSSHVTRMRGLLQGPSQEDLPRSLPYPGYSHLWGKELLCLGGFLELSTGEAPRPFCAMGQGAWRLGRGQPEVPGEDTAEAWWSSRRTRAVRIVGMLWAGCVPARRGQSGGGGDAGTVGGLLPTLSPDHCQVAISAHGS